MDVQLSDLENFFINTLSELQSTLDLLSSEKLAGGESPKKSRGKKKKKSRKGSGLTTSTFDSHKQIAAHFNTNVLSKQINQDSQEEITPDDGVNEDYDFDEEVKRIPEELSDSVEDSLDDEQIELLKKDTVITADMNPSTPRAGEFFIVMDYTKLDERKTLPVPKPKVSKNVFKLLKDCIGKDLSKFSVPVYFNEPLSMLQKM